MDITKFYDRISSETVSVNYSSNMFLNHFVIDVEYHQWDTDEFFHIFLQF